MATLFDTMCVAHDWAVDRIHFLSESNLEDAYAIQQEFGDWLDPNIPEHNVFSLEYQGDEEDED